jgi:phosphatidylglycerol:prolipoprotein diacylglycerol transferase
MNPHLLEDWLHGWALPPYFALLAVGFALAIFLARRWSGFHGMDRGRMVDFGIWMVIWGIIGSRLLHVIADGYFWDYVNVCLDPSKVDWMIDAKECAAKSGAWDAAAGVCHPVMAQTTSGRLAQCFAWADITAGGFAYYGGLIAAGLFSVYFVRRQGWSVARLCDMGGWTISLGLVWGRMGCFLAGCCFGSRTECELAVVFPAGSAASRQQWREGLLDTYRAESFPVHPTQLYEAAAALAIAALAYFVVRPRKRFDGQVFVVAMTLYAAARFAIEFIRRDDRGALLGLSTSQLVALGMVALCAYLWFHFKKKARGGQSG